MTKKLSVKFLEQLGACSDAIEAFAKQKQRDTIKVLRILIRKEEWDWFCWIAPRLMTHKQKVQRAIFCAEQVIDIFQKKYPGDDRPRKAIEVAKAWLKRPSEENKNAAANAAAKKQLRIICSNQAIRILLKKMNRNHITMIFKTGLSGAPIESAVETEGVTRSRDELLEDLAGYVKVGRIAGYIHPAIELCLV